MSSWRWGENAEKVILRLSFDNVNIGRSSLAESRLCPQIIGVVVGGGGSGAVVLVPPDLLPMMTAGKESAD